MSYDSVSGLSFGEQGQHRAFVTFFMQAELNGVRTDEAGHPVYDDVEFVRIMTPGDKHSEVVRAATPQHKREYAQQYAAFKEGIELAPEGAPLEHWPPLSPAQIANFKAMGIHTVEQLAEVSDGNLANLGQGARTLRDRAVAWLEQAAGGAPLSRLLAENEKLKADAEVSANTIGAMQVQLNRLEKLIAGSTVTGALE